MATAEASVADVRGHPIVRRASLIRVIEAVVGASIFLVLLQILLNFSLLDPEFWRRYGGSFETGIGTTFRFVAIILPLSAVLGFFLGWLRISRFRTLSWPVAVYVDFFGVSQDFIQAVVLQPGASVYWLLTMWTAVALVYFAMTTAVTQVLLFLERKFHVRGLEGVSV